MGSFESFSRFFLAEYSLVATLKHSMDFSFFFFKNNMDNDNGHLILRTQPKALPTSSFAPGGQAPLTSPFSGSKGGSERLCDSPEATQ